MANKRARDRQLAKLAAQRRAERHVRQQRRARVVGGLVGLLVIGLAAAGVVIVTRDDAPAAGPSPTPAAPVPEAPKGCTLEPPKNAGQSRPTFEEPPKMTIDPEARYIATMQTSCGTVEMELYPDVAPVGVNSFVFLAERGFYDGLTFHRIVADSLVQGGDPTAGGTGGPGYEFDNEISRKVRFDDGGILAYANSGPDTNGSQFFITLRPAPELDPTAGASYTIFGEVTEGMDVVQTIGTLPTADPGVAATAAPNPTVYIESISIDERR